MSAYGITLLIAYFAFGAVTNEIAIGPIVDSYISECHGEDTETMKNRFRWMCSILWIVFWPIFFVWGVISNVLEDED